MKKLAIIFLIVLGLALNATALEWRSTNQATISWDAVTTNINGDPIPPEHTIKYRIYLFKGISSEGPFVAIKVGETDRLQYVVTLEEEGKFLVGVMAVRYDENQLEIGVSEINWSDVNGEATPNPFGLIHYLPPAIPVNLR